MGFVFFFFKQKTAYEMRINDWSSDVCSSDLIPDFRKVLADQHARLLRRIYLHLAGSQARLPEDWVAAQIGQLNNTSGDIDTLTNRIAYIRTWTYIGQRADTSAERRVRKESVSACRYRWSPSHAKKKNKKNQKKTNISTID